MKVNGTGRITVRNRASLRKILPPVLIPDLNGVQAPAVCDQGARLGPGSTESQVQAPQRAGLRSGVKSANNIIVSGAAGASRIQDPGKFQENSRKVPGAVSAPELPGQSRIQAGTELEGSRRQGAEGSGGTPGDRLAGGQGRSVTMNVPDVLPVNVPGKLPVDLPAVMPVDVPAKLVPDISVQGDAVSVGPRQGGSGEAAEVVLPVLRRTNRVTSQVIPYQAGTSGMG